MIDIVLFMQGRDCWHKCGPLNVYKDPVQQQLPMILGVLNGDAACVYLMVVSLTYADTRQLVYEAFRKYFKNMDFSKLLDAVKGSLELLSLAGDPSAETNRLMFEKDDTVCRGELEEAFNQ